MLKYLVLLLVICNYSFSAPAEKEKEKPKKQNGDKAIACNFMPIINNPYKQQGLLAVDRANMANTALMNVQYCAYNERQSYWMTPAGEIIPSQSNGAIGKYYSAGISVQLPGMAQYQCYNITLYIMNAQANTYLVNGDEGNYYFTVNDNFCGPINTMIQLKLSGQMPVFSSNNNPPSVVQVNTTAMFAVAFCLPKLNSNFIQRVFWTVNTVTIEVPTVRELYGRSGDLYRYQGGNCMCTNNLGLSLPFDPTSCWTAVLTLYNIQPYDGGQYSVQLQNYAGMTNYSWMVTVGGGPPPTNIPCNINGLSSDLIFVLDGSSFATQQGFNAQVQLLNNILSLYAIGPNNVQVAVVVYATNAVPFIFLSSNGNTASLMNALTTLTYNGGNGQNIYAALQVVQASVMNPALGYRPGNLHQIYLFSSTTSIGQNPVPLAAQLVNLGVNIYAIGWGNQANMGQLAQITGMPSRITQVTSWNNPMLQTVGLWIEQDTCSARE